MVLFHIYHASIGDIAFITNMNPTDNTGSKMKTTKLWIPIVANPPPTVDIIDERTTKNMEPVIINVRYISTNKLRSWEYFLILLL